MRDKPNTDYRRGRVEIWSVLEEDQRWYAVLFPSLWLAGTLYHAYLRFLIEDTGSSESRMLFTVGEFTKDLGIVGLSAAVVALMVIAGRRGALALFDWGNKEKTRREAREQEREAWVDWVRRQNEAMARGEEFTEPSPAERAKESQGV